MRAEVCGCRKDPSSPHDGLPLSPRASAALARTMRRRPRTCWRKGYLRLAGVLGANARYCREAVLRRPTRRSANPRRCFGANGGPYEYASVLGCHGRKVRPDECAEGRTDAQTRGAALASILDLEKTPPNAPSKHDESRRRRGRRGVAIGQRRGWWLRSLGLVAQPQCADIP